MLWWSGPAPARKPRVRNRPYQSPRPFQPERWRTRSGGSGRAAGPGRGPDGRADRSRYHRGPAGLPRRPGPQGGGLHRRRRAHRDRSRGRGEAHPGLRVRSREQGPAGSPGALRRQQEALLPPGLVIGIRPGPGRFRPPRRGRRPDRAGNARGRGSHSRAPRGGRPGGSSPSRHPRAPAGPAGPRTACGPAQDLGTGRPRGLLSRLPGEPQPRAGRLSRAARAGHERGQ